MAWQRLSEFFPTAQNDLLDMRLPRLQVQQALVLGRQCEYKAVPGS